MKLISLSQGDKVWTFKYDALGRRVEKTVNGKTTQYLYDGLDIIQEIEDGMVSANYIRTLNIDEPLVRIKSDGTIRYYQQDALGSVVAITDESGTVKTTYTYDPYGNTTLIGEQSDNPFQYTGRENDETGLYYYRFRYYSPEQQRFISEDPLDLSGVLLLRQDPITSDFANQIYNRALRNPQLLSEYLYTINNPLIYTDPYGYNPIIARFIRWVGKQFAKQIGKFTGKNIGKSETAVPEEEDDDGDGILNFRDPDSEYCKINCQPIPPEKCH